MQRRFNITGYCNQKRNYMVDLTTRMNAIRSMITDGEYFVINRARQYGKTTLLKALVGDLEDEYVVFLISFEGLGENDYAEEETFCRVVCDLMLESLQYISKDDNKEKYMDIIRTYCDNNRLGFRNMSKLFTDICTTSDKPVVLMVDEVDQAGNYAQFLSFLGVLRNKYMNRDEIPTFQSVILAGVYDIKSLKLKVRQEQEHQYNSPWNIAAKFDVDMSFSVDDICGMLEQYAEEREITMNVEQISRLLYDYTSGYPFLVSRLCKMLDEELNEKAEYQGNAWNREGVLEAVRCLLIEKNTLFDSLDAKIANYPELKEMLSRMLFNGERIGYYAGNDAIEMAIMFGFVKVDNAEIVVANKIFEIRLYNRFLGEETVLASRNGFAPVEKSQFIQNGQLNMHRILEKFVIYFTDIYGEQPESFVEENGRRLFLLYLRPIINGTGNYYIEAQTRDQKRIDVIIDYLGKQYVIEMKIWHGDEYNRRGERQLADYLKYYHLDIGYMVSFNFNKKKEQGVKDIKVGDKLLVEAIV